MRIKINFSGPAVDLRTASLRGTYPSNLGRIAHRYARKIPALLESDPCGPEHLHTSSRLAVGPDGNGGQSGITIERAIHNAVVVSKATRCNDNGLFKYKLCEDEDSPLDLVDYYVKEPDDKRVCGFERVPDVGSGGIYVLRHRRWISILGSDGDILNGWRTESDAVSACSLSLSDALCTLSADGSIAVNSLETAQPVNVWHEAADVGR